MSTPEKTNNMKNNANILMNALLLIFMSAGGYMVKRTYENTEDTKASVATIQTANIATLEKLNDFKAQMLAVQTDLSSLRNKIQANEIEIIKLQRKP